MAQQRTRSKSVEDRATTTVPSPGTSGQQPQAVPIKTPPPIEVVPPVTPSDGGYVVGTTRIPGTGYPGVVMTTYMLHNIPGVSNNEPDPDSVLTDGQIPSHMKGKGVDWGPSGPLQVPMGPAPRPTSPAPSHVSVVDLCQGNSPEP
jgi:hypothetical protein